MVQKTGKKWCKDMGVELDNFREAVDHGRWHFDVLVIECVAFDRHLYQRLTSDD
jgi:hypothetical protein